jgi:hypothetical protein
MMSSNLQHFVVTNLHIQIGILHYMKRSGMSVIILAYLLARTACIAELPTKVVRQLL